MIVNFNKKLFNKKYIALIEKAYEVTLKLTKVPCKDLEINVSFVSKSEIKKLNNDFRKKDSVTDVLSFPNLLKCGEENMHLIADKLTKKNFPMEINPENNCIFLGDICICKSKVRAQAKDFGNLIEREMVYMAVHGLLHLLGYDHLIDEDKKVMREMEEKIMKKINLERN